MQEKVIDSWLTNIDERSLQSALSCILTSKGHNVVHISRHCALEQGKDVISLDKNKTPCVYQLKVKSKGKISMSDWRGGLNSQLIDLVELKIQHPRINPKLKHKSYLVVNCDLDEEVSSAIIALNQSLTQRGYKYGVELILNGDLKSDINALESKVWPKELSDHKLILELFLEDGNDYLKRDKLTRLIESSFNYNQKKKQLTNSKATRLFSGCALLCLLATENYKKKSNYFAEIEAWTIYISAMFAFVGRFNISRKYWYDYFFVAQTIIFNAIENIIEEIKERSTLIEGDYFTDSPSKVFNIRITYLVAILSFYAIWKSSIDDLSDEKKNIIDKTILKYSKYLILWGEAAVPQFLIFYWYLKKKPGLVADFFLKNLIHTICKVKIESIESNNLPNPYYQAYEILNNVLQLEDDLKDDDFSGYSYYIEGLMHLFVRLNWKQQMKFLWPEISRVSFARFETEHKWQLYIWRNEDGKNITQIPKMSESWKNLCEISSENKGSVVPFFAKDFFIFHLLFLIVYPHRVSPSLLRWLDSELDGL